MKIELSHDILAKSIYDKFSEEDKMRAQIRQLLTERLVYYKESNTLLSKDDLDYIKPHINSMGFGGDELSLVRKSKEKLKRRKKRLTALVTMGIALLVLFNLMTRYSNRKNQVLLAEGEKQVEQLAKEDSLKVVAERRADSLYQQLLQTNPEFTQQLIASFDTLKISKKKVENERNIAQSATLSALGESALKQEDENYAFRLAAKAWELNPDNKLACELLYKISEDPNYDNDHKKIDLKKLTREEHQAYVSNLIAKERNEKGRGELKKEKVQLIFNQENTIVQNKKDGVKDKLEHYYKKAKSEANSLKEKAKELK